MLRKPDAVCYRHLLQFELCARFHLGEKTFDGNRVYDGGLDYHKAAPVQVAAVNE